MANQCTHLTQVRDVSPNTPEGCEECLAMGAEGCTSGCVERGHVGCCDTHGTSTRQAFPSHTHPVIRSFEPGEDGAGATSMSSF